MHEGSNGALPINVKCRIGTDSRQPFTKLGYLADTENAEAEYQTLCRFIETVASNGVVTDFSVHARIAVLKKTFSPADNRKVPPLKYNVVRRLVQDFPHLTFTLNGGINTIAQVQAELEACPGLKGVMVGRAWAADPWSFAMADQLLYGGESPAAAAGPIKNRLQILEAYGRHADLEEANGEPHKIRRFIVKAVSPLFAGEANAKRYRIALDSIAGIPKILKAQGKSLAGQPPLSELIMSVAMEHLSEEALLRTPKESYDRLLWEEQKRCSISGGQGRSASIDEWQSTRKEEAGSTGSFEDLVAC
jgi:tRNA-dihydrouridine synthase A